MYTQEEPFTASDALRWLGQVASDETIAPAAYRVAIKFAAKFASGNSRLILSQPVICADLMLSPATVYRAVTRLVQLGHLIAGPSGNGRILSYSPQLKEGA